MRAWALLLLLGCDQGPSTRAPERPAAPTEVKPTEAPALPSWSASTVALEGRRLVAFGDVHGDWSATQRALRLGGLVDERDRWAGGTTVAVQVGDQLDRGDDERVILDHFVRLGQEAAAAGGAFLPLNGNHEAMNVKGDLRYVTPGGYAAFADLAAGSSVSADDAQKGRVAAFHPGGPYALKLAERRAVLIVGDTVFVHGGLLPAHVRYGIDKLNAETAAWMRGERAMPAIIDGPTAPLWTRVYSDGAPDCASLGEALGMLGAKRMVVAHTPQESGINAACGEQVWRVDTGMAKAYGGPVQVLEIAGGAVRVIKEAARPGGG